MYQKVSLSGSVANGMVILDPLSADPTGDPTAHAPPQDPPNAEAKETPFVAVNAPFDPQSIKDETAAAELVDA